MRKWVIKNCHAGAAATTLWLRNSPDRDTAHQEQIVNHCLRSIAHGDYETRNEARVALASFGPSASELVVRATRSGGPGGQHVNTSSTRIEITWDVTRTRALSEDERQRVVTRLGARVSDEGTVRVVASDSRSQRQNRERAESRLSDLIRRALAVPKARKRTRVPRGAVEARLEHKRHLRERKRQRRWKGED